MDGSKNIEEKLKIGFPPIVLFAAYRYTATAKINKLKQKQTKKNLRTIPVLSQLGS